MPAASATKLNLRGSSSARGRRCVAPTWIRALEPVFGQIKQARGFRQFLLRGIEKVKAEWGMICTAHNLRKLTLAAA